MRLLLGLLITLGNFNALWADSEAQVLITNRGEPAPFPHFPTLTAEPAVPPEPAFQFAPTPTGRAPPPAVTTPHPPFLLATPAVPEEPIIEDLQPLPEVAQALEQQLFPAVVPPEFAPVHRVPATPSTLVIPNSGTNAVPIVVGDHSSNPNFHYNYGVSDPTTGDQKSHTETREGDVVKGKYSFVDSDGSIRTVTYTADPIHGFQAVVESTPPSLRRAPPTSATLVPEAVVAPVVAHQEALPPVLANIPGIKPELLTEADLLLADPATHTHPLGSHSLLPIHPGYDQPHSHPPFNQHPVIDVETGEVLSLPPEPELVQLHPEHHPVHGVHHPALAKPVPEDINSIHHVSYPKPAIHPTPAPYGNHHHHHQAPYHPTPIPHHAATPIPPHHGHYHKQAKSVAPIPLGFQKPVPVKLHELHPVKPSHHYHGQAPYAHHGAYSSNPVVKSLHYDPYRPKHHYPQYEYKRQYYAQLY